MYERTIEVSVSQPEPELTFIQKLDIRELEDQQSMGGINADEYEKRKCKILDGRTATEKMITDRFQSPTKRCSNCHI
jgi:hypothetical protein